MAFAPHDEENSPDAATFATPPGINGDGPYEVDNMVVLSHLTLADLGFGQANILGSDCWGWTDSQTGKEYALACTMAATCFVDITDPRDAKYLGRLMTNAGITSWRDVKVYNDYAFVVSDNNDGHGMQVFDLTKLRTADPGNPQDFEADAIYTGVGSAHNVAINEETGYAYIVGADQANGGLHIVDIQNPLNPVAVGDFAEDGYTHDVSVFTYAGPDTDYQGREIAFACNTDSLTIVDVTDKSNTQQIYRAEYAEFGYTHQCWLTEDQRYCYLCDERDERDFEARTRIIVFDCLDLDNPIYLGYFEGPENSIDHNLYIKDDKLYLANYSSGVRVYQIDSNNPLNLAQIGHVDTFMTDNDRDFDGAWNAFPFFNSGSIIVTDRQNGLFVVRLADMVFEFPDGRPEIVSPHGDTEFSVQILPGYGDGPTAGPATLYIDDGDGYDSVSMGWSGGDLHSAGFVPTEFGSVVRYYISATTDEGEESTSPGMAPGFHFVAKSADAHEKFFRDTFSTDTGWTVDSDAEAGAWERAIPTPDGDYRQPGFDADGSGFCYVTYNAPGNSDVDNGSTTLTSPRLDAIGDGAAKVAYLNYNRWYLNSIGNNTQSHNDRLVVEISNDDGMSWTLLEEVGPGGNEVSGKWFAKTFRISDFVKPSDEMRVRFIASDLEGQSVVEAAIDTVEIQFLYSLDDPALLGDVNQNGLVELLDVAPFVELVINSEYQIEADMNQDGLVTLLDVALFVEALAGD